MATKTPDPRPQTAPAQGASGVASSPSLGRRLSGLFVRASLLGVVVSVLVHVFLAVVATGIVVAVVGAGRSNSEIAADAGLMVLSETELTELQEQAAEVRSEASESLAEPAPAPDLGAFTPDLATSGGAPSDGPASTTPGGTLGGAGDVTGVGEGGTLGGAGGGGARFFGVEAVGNRFAYIVDVSGSMAGPKIEALRRELEKSIDGLSEHSSFYVALFSTDARPLGARTKWTDATLKNKKAAFQLIKGIESGGATNPSPAFEQIFELRPRPEAIYFMTDGLFAPEVASVVRQQNSAGGRIIPIHCIAFVSQEAEDIMRRIANDSDGTYTFVPGFQP